MPSWPSVALPTALLCALSLVQAAEVQLSQDSAYKQQCAGMYSRKSWGGSVDPYILTKLINPDDAQQKDPTVSVVVFEWKDAHLIGVPASPDSGEIIYICDPVAVTDKHCTDAELGQFILSPSANASTSQILTEALHLDTSTIINYPIKQTGYYCVSTFGYNVDHYKGLVEFRNAYGELPAAQIPKLPFYGALVLVYALMALAWAFLYYTHRHDILPVQNYITAILVFLVIELFMTWLFYDYQNRHGLSIGTKALLVVVSVLSAARNSFSFFLLLIVCMGYGVVKPSLGKTMLVVRGLAIVHFIFGVIYAVASLTITPENAGPLILLVVMPLAATLTAFYIWTLNSLNYTLKDLVQRKQTSKAAMYRRLWWCILISILVVTAFFFVNSWTFADVSNEDFVPENWSSRWFILDGWLTLIYLCDVAYISWLWRPTANNRRFAMSDEIAQDDDGFEIASMRDSFDGDSQDDVEAHGDGNAGHKSDQHSSPPPGYGGDNRATSPLPAPVPQKPASSLPARRQSLDDDETPGETIFAVGDEDGEGDAFLSDGEAGHAGSAKGKKS